MTGPSREADDATIGFTFDGRPLRARPGDTLAAALLANGIGRVARSFKYHRPRGIMTAGVEEPNALVTIGSGGRREVNTKATDVFVYEGLVAASQNRWPSLGFDMGAMLGLLSKALPVGFYYKTFFGSAKMWMVYEHFIRRAAGLGDAPTEPDPDRFAQRAAFCDVLVVGAGRAGLTAALAAAQAGERVILIEQDRVLAPSLLRDPETAAGDWADTTAERIRVLGGRVLLRTTAIGYWDHNFVTLAERLVEPGQTSPHGVAQRLWQVRAGRVVLATGAIERPLAFAHNDRPGVMLSRSVRSYLRRFGVLPGQRVVIATNNDDAYLSAAALQSAGAEVLVVLDTRPAPAGARRGFAVANSTMPLSTRGAAHHLRQVSAMVDGKVMRWPADLLVVSGGFTPVVHLHMQAGGAALDWDEPSQAFVPGQARQKVGTIGAAAVAAPIGPTPMPANPGKAFIDFQNDVTLGDIDIAWAEGYRSVEHLKRYTTLGMATDQGKTSNMAALNRLAQKQGVAIPEAGLTTFRPPYTPVTMGLLAGRAERDAGAHLRRLALYDLHQARGAIWQPLGYWQRPRAYPQPGETVGGAGLREARIVRTTVGMTDVSTLAKFAVSGPDAAALLELVCATTVGKLAVGRGRYTFMLREDGLVFDDGTVWRLDEQRYLLTSSSGGADRMAAHLSYARQVLRPGLRVSAVNVQEHYAGIAVAGPQARAVLAALTGKAPPRHMSTAPADMAGVPVIVLAASYSGERAFEIYVEASQAAAVWLACKAEVAAQGGGLYGMAAMEYLRIEKGHLVVGGEIDGRLSPYDLGLGTMLNKAGGYVGAAGLTRPAFTAPHRRQLVGLEAIAGNIPEGAMLVAGTGKPVQGHVTAAGRRVMSSGSIALALLEGGFARHGEELVATSPTRGQHARVRVVPPLFHDSAGACYRD